MVLAIDWFLLRLQISHNIANTAAIVYTQRYLDLQLWRRKGLRIILYVKHLYFGF